MKFIIKICGITNSDDAGQAVLLGANALGLMFYAGSPRFISTDRAVEICRVIPDNVLKVGVFVDATRDMIEQATRDCRLDVVQLHGCETPEFCATIRGVRVMKALRVADESSVSKLKLYRTDLWLLDSFVSGAHGGTGQTFKWEHSRLARTLGTPFLLAGGLTPHNVAEAIKVVCPAGVDVSSGVESAPGRKDVEKMRAFIEAAKEAARPLENESTMANA